MQRLCFVALAACGTAPGKPSVVGDATMTTNGVATAMSAWATPGNLYDEDHGTYSDYYGWIVTLTSVEPGTPCTDPSVPKNTVAELFLFSNTRGPVPADAPIALGAFPILANGWQGGTGNVVWTLPVLASSDRGSGEITEFDEQHITGSFHAVGTPADRHGLISDATFTAPSCL